MNGNRPSRFLAILAILAAPLLFRHGGVELAADNSDARKPALTLKADGMVWSVAFSPDGKRLACGTAASTVIVWDLQQGKQVLKLDDFKSKSIGGVAFSPDGKHLAVVGSFPGSPWIRDAGTGKVLAKLEQGGGWSIHYSPDGKRLAWSSQAVTNNETILWDPAGKKRVAILRGHKFPMQYEAFSRDSKRLATIALDGEVKLWDAESGKEIRSIPAKDNRGGGVDFSPDGKEVVLSGGSPRDSDVWDIKVCSAADGKEVRRFAAHKEAVWRVCSSPDGKRLASAGEGMDLTVKLWDAITHKQLQTFKGHRVGASHGIGVARGITDIAWSRDSKLLASADGDGNVLVWRVGD
jgi:WD40 repeat protein